MTPDRWLRVNDLFDAATRLDPDARASWLRRACDGDDALCAEVDRLLAQDARADRDRFLIPPEPAGRDPDRTLMPGDAADRPTPGRSETVDRAGAGPAGGPCGFTPKAVIARAGASRPTGETRSVVQVRLRELAMIYMVMFSMAIAWRVIAIGLLVRRSTDPTVLTLQSLVIVALGGIAWLLSGPRRFSQARLEALELGMIAMLAGLLAFVQYRLILSESLLYDDTMMAQLTMKNAVLITAILILTSGLYVPKGWRRAALVAGPLAVLPFATLLVLYQRNPVALDWLWQGWKQSETPRIALFGFDAMLLLIVAVSSAYGAHMISGLRRQVAEARQLGQYRLGKRIGSGGMGEVYLAEHQLLKRPCAVKLIRPGGAADARALGRFEREVQITATLSHWNTVEIFDYGRTEDGTYYYVMEYLPGLSLAELVERHGPMPPARAVYLLRQVCGALREAHAAGLIHRDVKPSNIIAARRGGLDDVAKLLDFGLVRPATEATASHLTGEGQILGTPMFMSPEQARGGGREADERSDIYSLGAVAYYLLTGQPPFDDRDAVAVMIAHARDPVVSPSAVRVGIPADLERVVLRCLAKDPADRFPDAGSLERALAACGCAGGWDPERAARWWRDVGGGAAPASVSVAAVEG